MSEVAAVALVGLIVAAWMLYRQSTHHIEHMRFEQDAWREERRELLNRIATGGPVYTPPPFEPLEPREPDELAKVGTIAPPLPDDDADAA